MAVLVEFHDGLGRHGPFGAPRLAHAIEGEAVLDIQLQLIVFALLQQISPLLEPIQSRHAATRDIKIIASRCIGRVILDMQHRQ